MESHLYTATLIGLCNASLIVIINEAATEIADQKHQP